MQARLASICFVTVATCVATPATMAQTTYWALQTGDGLRCLEGNPGRSQGARVVSTACDQSAPQQWELIYVGERYYQVKNRASDYCATVFGRDVADNAPVVQWTCTSTQPEQNILLDTDDEATFTLQFRHSGACLDAAGNSGPRTKSIQYACERGNPNQIWNIVEVEP